ncbi:MAG: glycosyltransferase [Bacteroidetes bacterium]|nr:glycosyltransferase [Bacteroidota bacterium]
MLSIITPVLNGARFIELNILSILSLDIPFEHIIVDGGSTDGTLEIAGRYPHVKILHQKEDTGMYGAVHQGIIESSGDYICYVNSDDQVMKFGFEKMYALISGTENIDLVYSNGYFYFIDKSRFVPVFGKAFFRFFMKHNILPFLQPSTVYTRARYVQVGGFRYDKFRLIADFDFFQRLALLKDLRVKYLPVYSTVFIRRDDSLFYQNLDKLDNEQKQLTLKHRITITTRIFFQVNKLLSFFRTQIYYWRLKRAKSARLAE